MDMPSSGEAPILRPWCFRTQPAPALPLALVGLNPLIFHFTIYKSVNQWDEAPQTPGRARLAATLSLGLWSAIVVAGRAIAYFN